MLSFPKGGGRGALKEKQTNIDSPRSQLGLKWDEESPSLHSYPGWAATAEGSCLVFKQQHDKIVLLCWEDLWHWCYMPLPFGPGACPARHSQHGAGPAQHSCLCATTTHICNCPANRNQNGGWSHGLLWTAVVDGSALLSCTGRPVFSLTGREETLISFALFKALFT